MPYRTLYVIYFMRVLAWMLLMCKAFCAHGAHIPLIKLMLLCILQCYRQVKMQNRLYDRPDLVHHLYKQMSRDGYRGGPVTHICR